MRFTPATSFTIRLERLVEDVIRDARPVSGHKVARGDAAQRESVIVSAAVAHDADRAGVGQNGEVLVDLSVQTCICDLLTENRIRLAQNVALLLGDLAGDADAETGTRNGWRITRYFGRPSSKPS